MILCRAPRSPALAPWVNALWVHQGRLGHRYERVLPSGQMQLLVNLHRDALSDYTLDGRAAHCIRGAGLQGPRTAPVVIDTAHQQHICGVSFAVGGAWPLVGIPASELRDAVVDLADLWGGEGNLVRERLLEARDPVACLEVLERVLLARTPTLDPGQAAITTACRLLGRGASVRSVGDRLGLSPRRLINLFQKHVGIGPKQVARIARFQAVLADVDARVSWVDLAARHGFSDQAHMIREFRTFAGVTPSAHRPRSDAASQHVPLEEGQFSSIRARAARADCQR